jgi:hypothetical protein
MSSTTTPATPAAAPATPAAATLSLRNLNNP